MKTMAMFCCNPICLNKEIQGLIVKNQGQKIKVIKPINMVLINKDRHMFFVDINSSPEKIRGLILDSYNCCLEYVIDDKIEQYLYGHTR